MKPIKPSSPTTQSYAEDDIPTLDSVVQVGTKSPKIMPATVTLDEMQLTALTRQIDMIIQKHLQQAVKQAIDNSDKDIKSYLAKVLPEMLKRAKKT